MGFFDGCLLASDVDSTLLVNGELPQINIERIKFFVKQGGKFALATGRTPSAMTTVVNEFEGLLSTCIVANGSVLYDFENDRSVIEHFIPQNDRYIVKEVLKVCNDVGIEIHSGKNIFLINRNAESDDHAKYENLSTIPLEYEEALGYNWNKVIYLFSGKEESDRAKKRISECENNSHFFESSAVVFGRKRCYYEHVPHGISKGSALRELCEVLNIKKGGCFAIGDYYNDLEMIAAADIGAATAEAPDDVKKVADVTVTSAKNGAVADFIDYLCRQKGF